jgi:hypothetical protein
MNDAFSRDEPDVQLAEFVRAPQKRQKEQYSVAI